MMRVLWICGLPEEIGRAYPSLTQPVLHARSWVVAHLPPPKQIDLHIACLWPGARVRKALEYGGAQIHLLPCPRRGRSLFFFQRDVAYFKPLFNELKPDIVHGWGSEDSFGFAARRLSPPHHVIGIQGLVELCRQHESANL